MTALRDNACMTNTEFLLQKGGDLINSVNGGMLFPTEGIR